MQRLISLAALAFAAAVHAQSTPTPTTAAASTAPVAVTNAWVRASVPGQSGSGAFMTLTAREPLLLVGVATPVARVAEIHEMRMDGDVMRMRPVGGLELPPGQPVELKPGGFHVMLMQLQAQLKPQTQVPLTLSFRNPAGMTSTLALSVPVAAMPPAGAAAPAHRH